MLHKLSRLEPFKRRELGFSESDRHTVQRTLGEMEDMGWLYRDKDRGKIWKPGPVARLVFGGAKGFTEGDWMMLRKALREVQGQTGEPVEEVISRLRDNNSAALEQ